MYFYCLESDYQDRDLGMVNNPIQFNTIANEQAKIIADNKALTVDMAIFENANSVSLKSSLQHQSDDSYQPSDLASSQIEIIGCNFRDIELEEPQPIVPNGSRISVMVSSIIKAQEKPNPLLEKIDALFSDFVGMTDLKEEITRQASFIKVQQMRKAKGLPATTSPSKHMVFTGGPGTGKTTLARVVADVYYELGVLKTNNVVETDRSGLVAEYLGQTAIKTKALIDSAIGGVLFIDEAYSLTKYANHHDSFGSEAIDTLLKMMEDHRDDLVVIVAGYGDEMDQFIDSNPGLKSRFNRYMDFPDYSEEELWEILLKLCASNGYTIDDQAQLKPYFMEECQMEKKSEGDQFGNARYVRNLFEKIIEAQSYRLIKDSEEHIKSLQSLKKKDFYMAIEGI